MEMIPEKKTKVYTAAQALSKAEAWCAYQDRCQQEMRDKLYDWGIRGDDAENVIAELIARRFIDEERFAVAFAGGKFRIKKWGRVKIRQELKRKKISDYCIRKGIASIDEDEYQETLKKLAAGKVKTIREKHPLKKKYKLMSFLVSRGFETELVRGIVDSEGADSF